MFLIKSKLSFQAKDYFHELPEPAIRYMAAHSHTSKSSAKIQFLTLIYKILDVWSFSDSERTKSLLARNANLRYDPGSDKNPGNVLKYVDLHSQYLVKFNEIGLAHPKYSVKKVKRKAKEWLKQEKINRAPRPFRKYKCLKDLKLSPH